MNRLQKSIAPFALSIGICACVKVGNSLETSAMFSEMKQLTVLATATISMPEVSGLALVTVGSDVPSQIFAIGDLRFLLSQVSLTNNGDAEQAIVSEMSPADFGAKADSPSQWEGIAADNQGNYAIMQEYPGALFVFKAGATTPHQRIDLTVKKPRPLVDAWESDSNSRGEGLILLNNGHIIVLKEKKPPMLIEFGPAGETPAGWAPELFLKPEEAFRWPKGEKAEFVALHGWPFRSDTQDILPDASDLALGPDGKVYVLSDQSATIARFEGRLRPDEATVRHRTAWKLPKDIEKPEGLVIDRTGHPWVASDQKSLTTPNLFRLSRITD